MPLHGTAPAAPAAIFSSSPVVDTVIVAKPVAMSEAQLIEAVNASHAACSTATTTALSKAIETGELLIEAKRRCRHGEWQQWLLDNFDGSPRLARNYSRLASRRSEIEAKRQGSATLSIEAAIQLVTQPRNRSLAEAAIDAAGSPCLNDVDLGAAQVAIDQWTERAKQLLDGDDVSLADIVNLAREAEQVAAAWGERDLRNKRELGELLSQPLTPAERSELDQCEAIIGNRPTVVPPEELGIDKTTDPLAYRGAALTQVLGNEVWDDPYLPDLRSGKAFMGYAPEWGATPITMAQVWPSERHPGAFYVTTMDPKSDLLSFTKRPVFADHSILRHCIFNTSWAGVAEGWTWIEIDAPFFAVPECAFATVGDA